MEVSAFAESVFCFSLKMKCNSKIENVLQFDYAKFLF